MALYCAYFYLAVTPKVVEYMTLCEKAVVDIVLLLRENINIFRHFLTFTSY